MIKQIKAFVEQLKKSNRGWIYPEDKYDQGKLDGFEKACNKVLGLLNNFEEQFVTKNLEEAAMEHFEKFKYEGENSWECDPIEAFKAGAIWQKEQMLQQAIEGTIHSDKVKPIVIKEE